MFMSENGRKLGNYDCKLLYFRSDLGWSFLESIKRVYVVIEKFIYWCGVYILYLCGEDWSKSPVSSST